MEITFGRLHSSINKNKSNLCDMEIIYKYFRMINAHEDILQSILSKIKVLEDLINIDIDIMDYGTNLDIIIEKNEILLRYISISKIVDEKIDELSCNFDS